MTGEPERMCKVDKVLDLYNHGDNFAHFLMRISTGGLAKLKAELEELPQEKEKLDMVITKLKERTRGRGADFFNGTARKD